MNLPSCGTQFHWFQGRPANTDLPSASASWQAKSHASVRMASISLTACRKREGATTTRPDHPLRSTGLRLNGFHKGLNLLHQVTYLAVLHFCREGKRHTAQGLPVEVKEEPAFLVLSGSSPTELGCDTDYISIPHISD
ncbi:hypothetical protein NXY15_22160 [Bacteroides thetaiotaomicron]|nr:hypothetical protein NXY15_22160 [Bacteroides thetaiotaomicron]